MSNVEHPENQVTVSKDAILAEYWFRYVHTVLDKDCNVQLDWVKRNNMTVAVQHCGLLGTRDDHMIRISSALQKRNISKVYGFQYEIMLDETVYTLNTTVSGLDKFYYKARTVSPCITLPGLPFLVLLDWEDFNVYTGERSFVEDCLGMPLSEAYQHLATEVEEGNVYDFFGGLLAYYKEVWLP